MSNSQWHKFYTVTVEASPAVVFDLLSDLRGYERWLPPSSQYRTTTEVEPYPVQLGSRYHDGKPEGRGNSWRGEVTGFHPPGSLDFHHTIAVKQLRGTVEVHIHYSLEPEDGGRERTRVGRWLVLDVAMPLVFRPLRPLVIRAFDQENERTLAALQAYAETRPGG